MVLCGVYDPVILISSNLKSNPIHAHFVNKFPIFGFLFRLLNKSRDTVLDIKKNTEYDPGWIENGGIFIARTKVFTFVLKP